MTVAVAIACPRAARAGDEQELDYARRLLDQRDNEKAAARFSRLLDPSSPSCPASADTTADGCRLTNTAFIRRARGLYAIALNELKRRGEAKEQFKKLLIDDPSFTPSAADYSLELIKIFGEAKEEMQQLLVQKEIDRQKKQKAYEDSVRAYDAWVDEMERLASTETLYPQRSRVIAAVPFGVGQFQNGDTGLGIFFLSSELVFATGALVSGAWYADLVSCSTETPQCADANGLAADFDEIQRQTKTLQIVNWTSMGLLAAAILSGIIEAEVDFRPGPPTTRKRKVRPRPPKPVPPSPSVTLNGGPDAPGTVGVGVSVRF